MGRSDKSAEDLALDAMFAAAKSADPVPSSDLMARILADAGQAQESQAARKHADPVVSVPFAHRFRDFFGGWAGASALTASVCFGLVLGVSSPDTVLSYIPLTPVESDAALDVLGVYGEDAIYGDG